jgi:cytochrome c556
MSRHLACILLCLTALRAAAAADEDPLADLKKGQSKDVVALIERIVECNHWSGEEPYDAERKKEISSTLADLKCGRLDLDESRTIKKYANNPKALKALKQAKVTSY